MSKRVHFLIPGDLCTLSGGYLYDRHIVSGLRSLGWEVTVHNLDPGFPQPGRKALDEARVILNAIPTGGTVVIDGLALGGMPRLMEEQTHRLILVALIHHPLASETGLKAQVAERFALGEAQALSAVHHIIVTGAITAKGLTDGGTAPRRIGVVTPGTTSRVTRARGSENPIPNLLCVGALIPRKGHLTLLKALSFVADRPWQLNCVGNLERSPESVAAVRAEIKHLDLVQRVVLLGEVDNQQLHQLYRSSNIFVLASFWEGYGMAFSEALSYGLPIVATTAGAIPQTVTSGAGLLIPPNDSPALGRALAAVLDDAHLRARMANAAWSAGKTLPTWHQASEAFSGELRRATRQ